GQIKSGPLSITIPESTAPTSAPVPNGPQRSGPLFLRPLNEHKAVKRGCTSALLDFGRLLDGAAERAAVSLVCCLCHRDLLRFSCICGASTVQQPGGGRFRNHLHSVRNCGAVRRKLERGRPDYSGPLRKHAVRPRNKRRSTLLCQWILRLRLSNAVMMTAATF